MLQLYPRLRASRLNIFWVHECAECLHTAPHFNHSLTLWCAFGLRVIKCGRGCIYRLFAIRNFKKAEKNIVTFCEYKKEVRH